MNEVDFRNLVREMLDAQQTYFKKGRKKSDLDKSIELETKVRKELAAGADPVFTATLEVGEGNGQQLPLIEEVPAERFSQLFE